MESSLMTGMKYGSPSPAPLAEARRTFDRHCLIKTNEPAKLRKNKAKHRDMALKAGSLHALASRPY
ncbi:hypothetical protein [Ectopseudomonas alcaliphila]|uniref:hypothetical protein n=1 Tax=Ectopseudomonas alcaliphila TaxID=101564 RepID=UPI00278B774D|nr:MULTISPECIES: hypothetical protein [Pseudomonas]MDP9939280.1 hypothetical protein [Pseudomonas sp. 3400]MDR7011503.1 hypothetical protein [Pseudomonas alcaliphila]